MDSENACVFCEMVAGRVECHRIWEDDQHLAFLSSFPNTVGVSVVIPKAHHESYVFQVPEAVVQGLMHAVRSVAQLLDATFEDVGRCAMAFEGFGVNHLHAKVFPLHGTNIGPWRKLSRPQEKFFSEYEGFVSTHDGAPWSPEELDQLAERIRNVAAASGLSAPAPS